MRMQNVDERVHVLDQRATVWSVLEDIANSGMQEDAFYVCDVGDIVRKHEGWLEKMPRVKPFYAVKCNDSLAVLEVLAALGTGFDCASKAEINKILSLGVASDRVIFANPAKPASHIRHASTVGVDTMVFDNEIELHKIKTICPRAKLVLRIRCDALDAQCQLGMKFGCDPVLEAPELLRVARLLDLNVVGVSFHVGSGCREPPVFSRAIKASRDVFDCAAELGYQMTLLDIGGGFPGGQGTSLDKIAEIVNASLDAYFPDLSTEVIAEPGRYYVSSAFTLACNVHSVRSVSRQNQNRSPEAADEPSNIHFMYYINDGVYGSFNCILYDHQVVVPKVLNERPGRQVYPSSIWGPTCDGLDQVNENLLLPELKIGEWLVYEDMGAYTLPVASPFNGFPVPTVHFVADENIWLLMKDILPLTEDHFVMGNPPPMALKMRDLEKEYTLPTLPIRIEIPYCNGSTFLEGHVIDVGPVE